MSISRYFDDLGNYVWDNKTPYVWSVEGITVCEQALEGGIAHYKKVVEIGDNHYSYIFTRTVDPQGVNTYAIGTRLQRGLLWTTLQTSLAYGQVWR